MPQPVHDFSWPDRLVIGTIGPPGQRSFYLQVRAGAQLVSVALEKEQSAALATKVDEILDQLMAIEGNPHSVPAGTPDELIDNDPLEEVESRFRTGAMSLGWDPSTAQIVIEAHAMPADDAAAEQNDWSTEHAEAEIETVRVRIPVGAARAFTKRTRDVVGAGRPPCPFCGYPVDAGHICAFPEL